MTDVFAKMGELLSNVDLIKEREAEQLAAKRKKKKVKRKKKKAAEDDSGQDSAGPSCSASPERPYYTHQVYGQGQLLFPGAGGLDFIPSPSARKDAYSPTGRPRSAMPASAMSLEPGGSPGSLPAHLSSSPGSPGVSAASPKQRPMSAAPRFHNGGAVRTAATAAAGPSAKAQADAVWRDVSPPKYTAASFKQPELGSVPGKYQSPPWSPLAAAEKDPARQELDNSVKEERFQHILAVPAHVLARNFFHPSCPSDRARAKQLAADLKTARMDRSLVIKEKVALEKQMISAQSELQGLRTSVRHLQAHSEALQDRLADLLQSNKQLHVERAQMEDRLRQYDAVLGTKGADLMQQLVAAKQENATLRQQLTEQCSDEGYEEE